jgi:hypothetical protein
MNALPRDKLSELLAKHGASILGEPERCRAWLLYSCPEHKKEINVLLSALGQRVPQDLLASGKSEALVQRMVDDLAMTEEAARWAVESWEMILRNVLPAGLPMGLPANGDNTERIQARAPLPETKQPTATPGPATSWVDEVRTRVHQSRLLQRLKKVQEADAAVWQATSYQVENIVFPTVIISLFATGGLFYALFPSTGFACVFVSLISTVGLGYLAYQHGTSKKERLLTASKKRLQEAITATCAEFPGTTQVWGGEEALKKPKVVAELIKTVRARPGAVGAPIAWQPTAVNPPLIQPHRAAANPPLIQPHRGPLIFTLGVVGLFIPVFAIFPWILGHNDLEAMNAGKMDQAGIAQTTNGKTLGMIGCLVYGGIILLVVLIRVSKSWG